MGQAFRWRPLGEGWFLGVIGETLAHIRQTGNGVEYRVGGPDGERSPDDEGDKLLRRHLGTGYIRALCLVRRTVHVL